MIDLCDRKHLWRFEGIMGQTIHEQKLAFTFGTKIKSMDRNRNMKFA